LQCAFDEARKKLLQAYEAANQLLLSREEALALEFLGDLCRDEGAYDKARRYYSRALAIGRSIAPDGDIVMEVLRRQGECLERMGRQSEAVAVLGNALTMTRRQGDRFEQGVVRRVLAETLLGLGDLESAAHHATESISLLTEVGANHERALASLVAARIKLAGIDGGSIRNPGALLEEAWQAAMAALDLFLKMEVDHWTGEARRLLAVIADRRTEQEQAERMIVAADRLHGRRPSPGQTAPIIHVSARMRDLIQLADAFAVSDEPVLVTGKTGTGKELFAQRLHNKSPRHGGELVSVNVSAIPESLFAREFFGHVKGSFSGADHDGIGLAAQADRGTLFLDEIGDLPLELQPQLLRLLQDGTYQSIGDPSQRRADIRLIAATNADLQALVAEGRFRADLYYRLKVLELPLPSVPERKQDILPLLKYFLSQAAKRPVEPGDYFTVDSLERMEHYRWPGNVREIAMVARRAQVQMASRGTVEVSVTDNAGQEFRFCGPHGIAIGTVPARSGGRSRILLALAETDGNRAEAARRLGVSRSTLYRQMDKLGIAG
jgi:two-component system NtrC family response regulator